MWCKIYSFIYANKLWDITEDLSFKWFEILKINFFVEELLKFLVKMLVLLHKQPEISLGATDHTSTVVFSVSSVFHAGFQKGGCSSEHKHFVLKAGKQSKSSQFWPIPGPKSVVLLPPNFPIKSAATPTGDSSGRLKPCFHGLLEVLQPDLH